MMNGAELLVRTAVASGVDACFANAGTTEIPIVTALDATPGIRVFLGLFEGVCTGAADGYGRMLGKPAMTLLHLGPGLANGIANLHNARRANSPVFNVIGEHASWHRDADPPLAMDIEGLARTVSGWCRTSGSAQDIAGNTADAVAAARLEQVTTLIVPNDFQLAPCEEHPAPLPSTPFDPLDTRVIELAAARLRTSRKVALILGRGALRRPGLLVASRIRKVTGWDLFTRALPGYIDRGSGLPSVERLPHFPEKAMAALSGYEAVLLAGTPEPVTFFGYPGVRSRILRDDQVKINLCTDRQDVVEALESFANALGARASINSDARLFPEPSRPSLPEGSLTPEKACVTLAALQPENAIIVDEAVSSGHFHYPLSGGLPPHTILTGSGGSIGIGIPCATGAAIACPDRPVINLEADGSALYTIQALWTQAHEGLNVTTLICSNRSYRILQMELDRAGFTPYGPKTRALTELTQPAINWVNTAEGFGVPGISVSTAEALARELRKALKEPGPHLIEMLLP
jgi:acetolactate synthase-1/2/3 large subunit